MITSLNPSPLRSAVATDEPNCSPAPPTMMKRAVVALYDPRVIGPAKI